MTVKCLTASQKSDISFAYTFCKFPIEDLVSTYCKSRRTIMRVLTEEGVAPVTLKRVHKPKVKAVMPIVHTFNPMRSPEPGIVFMDEPPAHTPWYARAFKALATPFVSLVRA